MQAEARLRRGGYLLAALLAAWFVLDAALAPAPREPIVCGTDFGPDADTVVMLSAAWCGYCQRARAYLQDAGVRHCEYDIETSAVGRARFAALPQRVIPVIMVRDDVVVGFNQVELEQAFAAHGLTPFTP